MPRSLNNTPTVDIPTITYVNNTNRATRVSKSTIEMVNNALIELHSLKGTTLPAIYKYILTNYKLATISNHRKILIKKHISDLKESDDVENKTGKGFSGHMKLKDKKKFITKVKAEEIQKKEQKKEVAKRYAEKKSIKAASKQSTTATANKTSKNTSQNAAITSNNNAIVKKVVKRKIKKPKIPLNQPTPVVPTQTTPDRNDRGVNRSMFDTPSIFPSQVHASTPFLESHRTFAPGLKANTKRKRVLNPINNLVGDTPRSSLSGKKRRIQKRNE